MAGLGSDEIGLRREEEAGEDAVVFGAPTGGDSRQVELFGGAKDGEWECVGASSPGDDALLPTHR